MAKILIYGYSIGMRSSRGIEYACANCIDFIWLAQGLKPDHDTIATFRRENLAKFKELFKWTVKVCREAGMVSMERVAVDTTRVEANNSRDRTMQQSDLKTEIAKLEEHIEKLINEAEEADRQEDRLFGQSVSPNKLPEGLRDAKERKEKLEKALKKVREKEKRAEGRSYLKAGRKRVPVVDVDSDVMRDKKGVYGPNYSPYLAVDTSSGVIVSQGVTTFHDDAEILSKAIEEAEENTGEAVSQVLADSVFSTVENLLYCEGRGIDPCMAPMHTSPDKEDKIELQSWPDDVPATAVHVDGHAVDGISIPLNPLGVFDKSAFQYDPESDEYTCPLGHKMPKLKRKNKNHKPFRQNYKCLACSSCPFRIKCTKQGRGRTVDRRPTQNVHDRHRDRMSDLKHKTDFKLRKQSVEPVIGIIKQAMNVRKFLLRGQQAVNAEWNLVCSAFNLRKLIPKITQYRILPILP
jgi:transposase